MLSSQLGVPWFSWDLKAQKVQLWDEGDAKFSTSTRERVGDAVAAVLTHPKGTKNKVVYINSFTTSQKQILASLEKVSGKKWETETVNSAEEARVGMEMLKDGNMMGIGAIVKGICFTEGWGVDFEAEEVEVMNMVLGLEKQDLDEVIGKILKDF